MSEVTIVCCYNDLKMYDDFVNTLKAQNISCELIGIDNRNNKAFKSCSRAYNSVKDKITTKYVIYSHQDIVLTEPDILAKFVSYLSKIDADDILGVAGVRFDMPGVFTNIKHRWNSTGEISYAGGNRVNGGMMECDTVDECFFGGCAEHFRQYPFDEVVCDNWHFYVADACLRTKQKLLTGGGHKVYVCDISLLHLSSGVINTAFHWGFFRLCRKYQKIFPVIATTSVRNRTDFIHAFPYFMKYYTRALCRGILKRMGLYDRVKKLLR